MCGVINEGENETVVFSRAVRIRYEHRFATEMSGRKLMDDSRTGRDVIASDSFEDTRALGLAGARDVERQIAISIAAAKQALIDARELAATIVQSLVFDTTGIKVDRKPMQFQTGARVWVFSDRI